jgi:hypothetical protein
LQRHSNSGRTYISVQQFVNCFLNRGALSAIYRTSYSQRYGFRLQNCKRVTSMTYLMTAHCLILMGYINQTDCVWRVQNRRWKIVCNVFSATHWAPSMNYLPSSHYNLFLLSRYSSGSLPPISILSKRVTYSYIQHITLIAQKSKEFHNKKIILTKKK